MAKVSTITPCLWFDTQAEEAARFYCGIFENAKINAVTKFPAVGQDVHGKSAGSVMTVEFELNGLAFTALNGGPIFKFNEAVSLQVMCDTQDQVDHYWEKLGAGGDPKARQCGWLKDKFGLSWQIIPLGMNEMLQDRDAKKVERAFASMLQMKKLDLAALRTAFDGG